MSDSPRVPREVREEYGEWTWETAWQAVPQAITYRLTAATGEVRYLKVAEATWHPDLGGEADRMLWARNHLPVPVVLRTGRGDGVRWMVTAGLPGRDATDPGFRTDPGALVALLADGLRRFHSVPPEGCPFDFSVGAALELASRRLRQGLIQPERDFHGEFAHLTAAEAVKELEETRPQEGSLVVCHGDYCLPNVLIEGGAITGFVDLGELGLADRWWDLAVASWSLTWNLGAGFEEAFYSAYGVEERPDLIRFYRLLYDVVS